MFNKYLIIVSAIVLSNVATYANAEELRIAAYKAPFHVGQTVMACGKLAETKHLSNRHYLNLDNRYPNQTLTILIWETDYDNFETRLGDIDSYVGRNFCARGTIEDYRDNMQMKVSNPQYLRLMND